MKLVNDCGNNAEYSACSQFGCPSNNDENCLYKHYRNALFESLFAVKRIYIYKQYNSIRKTKSTHHLIVTKNLLLFTKMFCDLFSQQHSYSYTSQLSVIHRLQLIFKPKKKKTTGKQEKLWSSFKCMQKLTVAFVKKTIENALLERIDNKLWNA